MDNRLQGTQAELKEAGMQLAQLQVQLEKLDNQEGQMQQYKETISVRSFCAV